MLVTFRLKDKEVLSCDDLTAFTYKLNTEKEELEVYKNNEFLGYYLMVYGITEDEFIDYLNSTKIEIS